MKSTHILSIVALVAASFATAPSFAQAAAFTGIVNGGFEASTGNGTCASGWTCSNAGNFGEEPASFWNGQMAGSNLSVSPNGGNVLATWSIDAPNSISQTLNNLTVGSSYALSFYAASANRDATSAGTGTAGWLVSAGGSTLGTASVAIAGAKSATGWSGFNYSFVATSASEVLKFLSVSSVAVAPEPILLLDGVSVTAVPEPSTWALTAGGLLAIGGLVRRRQGRSA